MNYPYNVFTFRSFMPVVHYISVSDTLITVQLTLSILIATWFISVPNPTPFKVILTDLKAGTYLLLTFYTIGV